MGVLTPLIRIVLYIVGGWLVGRGLPQKYVDFFTSNPEFANLISEFIGGVIIALSLIWWRFARRFGWAT